MNKIGILLNLILILNCDGGAVVSSDNVSMIDYVKFSQITTSNNGNNLEVSGHVININLDDYPNFTFDNLRAYRN